MIEVKDLIKKIGEKTILRRINLSVQSGETVGILGPNGAGKSTILKILSGLIKPTYGEVMIDGLKLKEHEVEIKNKVGFLAHNSYLLN